MQLLHWFHYQINSVSKYQQLTTQSAGHEPSISKAIICRFLYI